MKRQRKLLYGGTLLAAFMVGQPVFSASQPRLSQAPKDPFANVPGVRVGNGPFLTGGGYVANPDFTKIGWIESRAEPAFVLNGEKSKPYKSIFITNDGKFGVLSSGGKAAYIVVDNDAQQHVVYDNKVDSGYKSIVAETLAVSPDGRHHAYAARKKDSRVAMVVDGKEKGDFELVHSAYYSADSKHLAYIATLKRTDAGRGNFDIYVDDQVYQSGFDFVGTNNRSDDPPFLFSPDSNHWAVWGKVPVSKGDTERFAVMCDGQMQKSYPEVVKNSLVYTTSGELLYAAGELKPASYSLIRNGAPGQKWNYIEPRSIKVGNKGKTIGMTVFSGNGPSLAEKPMGGQSWNIGMSSLAIDDRIVVESASSFALSPSSERRVYVQLSVDNVSRGPTFSKLTDGRASCDLGEGQRVSNLMFSADGRHWAALVKGVYGGSNSAIAYDGILSAQLPWDIRQLSFDTRGALTGLAVSGQTVAKIVLDPARLPKAPAAKAPAAKAPNAGGRPVPGARPGASTRPSTPTQARP